MKAVAPLLLLTIIATGTAFAAEPPKTSTKPVAPTTDHGTMSHAGHATPDAFVAFDTNKDGVLSKAELSKHPMAAHASMVDANKDGVLSRNEFAALQGM